MTPVTAGASTPLMPIGPDLAAYADHRPNDPRAVAAAATAFESVFVSLIMKEMRQTLSEGSMFDQDKGDVLGGLFDHYMGQHLAPAGALGIAAMLRKSWQTGESHAHEQPPGAPRPNSVHR